MLGVQGFGFWERSGFRALVHDLFPVGGEGWFLGM